MTGWCRRPAGDAERAALFEGYRLTLKPYVATAWGWDEAAQRAGFWQHHPLPAFEVIEVARALAGGLHVELQTTALWVRMLFLLPAFQRRGIGSALLHALHREALAQSRALQLKVLNCNPALALYLRLGFRVVSEDAVSQDLSWT